jgi:hypothetical protein
MNGMIKKKEFYFFIFCSSSHEKNRSKFLTKLLQHVKVSKLFFIASNTELLLQRFVEMHGPVLLM